LSLLLSSVTVSSSVTILSSLISGRWS